MSKNSHPESTLASRWARWALLIGALALATVPSRSWPSECATFEAKTEAYCCVYSPCNAACIYESYFCTGEKAPSSWECQGSLGSEGCFDYGSALTESATCSSPGTDVECGDTGTTGCGSFPKDCEPEPSDGDASGEGGGQGRHDTESACDTAGTDPIHLSTKSAYTEPYVDFAYQGVASMKLERSYSSADTSVPKPGVRSAGAAGIFGRGWHHNWESYLSCQSATRCTLVRGLKSRKLFTRTTSMTGVSGSEQWEYFVRPGIEALIDGDPDILVRKTDGEFVIFGVDGTELHYRQLDDPSYCTLRDPTYCPAAWGAGGRDVLAGGKAALVKVVSPNGSSTVVTRNWQAGVLLSLRDEATGNSIELTSNGGGDALARALTFNGKTYVTYGFSSAAGGGGAFDLTSVQAPSDALTLRSYVYDPDGTHPGHLAEVRGETPLGSTGPLLVAFGYDASHRAVSVSDELSNVTVSYPSAVEIGVTHAVTSSRTAVSTHSRGGGRSGVLSMGPTTSAQMQWVERQLRCFTDADGRTTWIERDGSRRVTRVRRFAPAVFKCDRSTPTAAMVAEHDESYGYGLERTLAVGIPTIKLDIPKSVTRASLLSAGGTTTQQYDFNSGGLPSDPAGYECQPDGALPEGAAPCRVTETGWTRSGTGTLVQEQRITYYSYDRHARVTQVIGPKSLTQAYVDDVVPIETRTYYPVDHAQPAWRGRLSSVSRSPTGSATHSEIFKVDLEYLDTGVHKVTYSSGLSYTLDLDSRGRAISILGPSGTTALEYFDGKKPSLVVSPEGGATRYGYEDYGRLHTIEALTGDPRPSGAHPTALWTERRTHDLAGNATLVERLDASGAVWWKQERTFDASHRPLKQLHPTSPDQSVSASWEYTAAGVPTAWQDELGIRTELAPDAMGRPTGIDRVTRDPGTNTILQQLHLATYTWEKTGDLVKTVTDGQQPTGNTTTYEHDDFGRVVTVNSPNALGTYEIHLAWDARDNLKQRLFGGTSVAYAYDGENRLTTVSATSFAGATPVYLAFTYDRDASPGSMVGMLRTASSGTSATSTIRKTTYSWSAAGRLESESVSVTGVSTPLVTSYTYDANGALWKVTSPSGLTAISARDKAGQITGVTVQSTTGATRTLASNVIHEPLGPVSGLTFGNGKTLVRTSNLRYEPTSIASGPVSLGYTPGVSGNIDQLVTGSAGTQVFTYDFANRLTSMTPGHGAGTPSYTYVHDKLALTRADLVSPTATVPAFAFGYDQPRNLSAVGQYDAAGATIPATVCLLHDALGRLSVVGPALGRLPGPGALACRSESDLEQSQPKVRFEYDAFNRRVARLDGSTRTEFLHNPAGNLLAELTRPSGSSTWSSSRDYVWLDGLPLAQLEYPGPAGRSDGYTYYFHLDHLGLPRALTSEAGATVWSALPARPFGDVAETTTTDPVNGRTIKTNLRLPGQYDERLLTSLGIQGPYYNWNRWYLPAMGRYLELDPIALHGGFNGPFGPNWYGYAEGNPLRSMNPTGLKYTCSKKGNQTTISATITIYGPLATPQLAQSWQQAINGYWNNFGNNFTSGGNKVVFNVAVQADPSSNWWFTAADAMNYVYVKPSGYRSNVWNGWLGNWSFNDDPAWVAAHEAGHIFGLPDDYSRKYWLFGPEGPNQGHEGHMMAEFWGGVAQHEIDTVCGCN